MDEREGTVWYYFQLVNLEVGLWPKREGVLNLQRKLPRGGAGLALSACCLTLSAPASLSISNIRGGTSASPYEFQITK